MCPWSPIMNKGGNEGQWNCASVLCEAVDRKYREKTIWRIQGPCLCPWLKNIQKERIFFWNKGQWMDAIEDKKGFQCPFAWHLLTRIQTLCNNPWKWKMLKGFKILLCIPDQIVFNVIFMVFWVEGCQSALWILWHVLWLSLSGKEKAEDTQIGSPSFHCPSDQEIPKKKEERIQNLTKDPSEWRIRVLHTQGLW